MITEQNMKDGYEAIKKELPEQLAELNDAVNKGDWGTAIECIAPINLALTGALIVEEFLNPTT